MPENIVSWSDDPGDRDLRIREAFSRMSATFPEGRYDEITVTLSNVPIQAELPLDDPAEVCAEERQRRPDIPHSPSERQAVLDRLSLYPHPCFAEPLDQEPQARPTRRDANPEEYQADPDPERRGRRVSVAAANATVWSSQIGDTDKHTIMLDLDVPATLLPSSTRGNSHFYADVVCTWEDYKTFLEAAARIGLLQPGYVQASIRRKATYLRLPWIKKRRRQ